MSEDTITVLILNNVKRVKSFKVNKKRIKFLIFSAISVVTLLAISIAANFYLYTQITNNGIVLTDNFLTQNSNPIETKTELSRVDNRQGDATNPDEYVDENSLAINSDTVESIVDPKPALVVDDTIYDDDFSMGNVSIENHEHSLEFNKIELNVTFNIVKKTGTTGSITGYVLVVAHTSDPNIPHASWPDMPLTLAGLPEDYSYGEQFSINILRPTQALMLLGDQSQKYLYYRIYVYSLDGSLLLRNTFLAPSI